MKKFIVFLIVFLGIGGAAYYFLRSDNGSSLIQRVSESDTLSGQYETSYSGFSLTLSISNAQDATLSVGANSLLSVSLNGTVDTATQTIEVPIDNSLIASAFGVEEGIVATAYYEQLSEDVLNLSLGNVTLQFERIS